MNAVEAYQGQLADIEMDDPTPGEHDLLVEVSAVSVNPVDLKIRQRAADSGDRKILGWDAVGRIKAVGEKASGFAVGDRVWYAGEVSRPGSNAELQCVDARLAAKAPQNLSDADAAAMPLTSLTAWELLFDRLQIPRGEAGKERVLLVVGAAGGVGSVLIQLARKLTQATVIGTASRGESREWVKKMGAHYVLDHSEPLSAELATTSLGDVTDVASLTHTTEHFAELVGMLRPQGRLALIDDPSEPLDINSMKQKSLSLHWEFMFTRGLFKTADMIKQQEILQQVAKLVDDGELCSTRSRSLQGLRAATLEQAHRLLQSGHTQGKVVVCRD
jgi:zinc-binding alcohol dehydrogenase family protein